MVSEVATSDGRRRAARGALGWPHARSLLVAVPAVAALLALSACTSGGGASADQSPVARTSSSGSGQPSAPASSSSSAVPVAAIATKPSARLPLNPTTPITVTASDGRLTSVRLVNPDGKRVTGTMSADGTSWHSTEVLGYAKTYTLSAIAVNSAGRSTKQTKQYTTVSPANLTMPYLNTTGGGALENGATYGVGIVPVVRFDESITNKKAAEQALVVRTSPHVNGAWNWVSDTEAHWRPATFFKPGTHVSIHANVYGVQVGPGLYGQSDANVSFKIGAKHMSIADDTTHTVRVYYNNKLVRSMPTSMGQGGYVTGTGGQQVSLWTMSGFYTVIGHENPAIMSSASFGLPANSPYGYAPEAVYWATKISTDGIYLHSAPWSVGQQGYTDVSHGCLNLSPDNATWYYNNSKVGDIVQVIHTTGPKINIWQNGDWSVPWSTWLKGSALH